MMTTRRNRPIKPRRPHRLLYAGAPTIKIAGVVWDQGIAVVTHRCAECLGDLVYFNAGLVCAADRSHKGFVHRDEAAKIAAEQARQYQEVEAGYEIVNGEITPRSNDYAAE